MEKQGSNIKNRNRVEPSHSKGDEMKHVLKLLLKDWFKSKYIWLLPLVILLVAGTYFYVNNTQTGNTQQELTQTFEDRRLTVSDLISKWQLKEQMIGVTTPEKQAIDSLLIQEQYIKDILAKLESGDLHIAQLQLSYLQEYHGYTELVPIPYLSLDTSKETTKAQDLIARDLSYIEEKTPYDSALYSKQVLEILLNPITLFLLLLIFMYRYTYDRENRSFDFFKLNSLSNRAIYFGYLIPMLLVVGLYVTWAVLISNLPVLFTGNLQTLHYPLEILVLSQSVWVPVWKWLVFIPLGWTLLMTMLLLVMTYLIKQRVTMGVLLALLGLPFVGLYMLAMNTGFSMANPVHLVVFYEAALLTSSRFIWYLALMSGITFALFISVYAAIGLKKNSGFRLPTMTSTLKSDRKSVV